jgi:diaminopimelate epimerase
MIPFVKMHGCGNDFVLLRDLELQAAEALGLDAPELARRACDRHFGVGADGLLVYGPRPARDGVPHLRMRYWNADGSHAEMCGNGARCVVRLAFERHETGSPLVLETDAGTHRAEVQLEAGRVDRVHLDMGPATWEPSAVPVVADAGLGRETGTASGTRTALAADTAAFVERPVRVGDVELHVTALSMGNPHAVVFVADRAALDRLPLESWGRALSEHPHFPRGANASFVAEKDGELHVRVWERGVGVTLACGTASCAALAAALRLGRVSALRARVHLPGGTVEVRQDDAGHLWLSGPATYVAEGILAPELLRP